MVLKKKLIKHVCSLLHLQLLVNKTCRHTIPMHEIYQSVCCIQLNPSRIEIPTRICWIYWRKGLLFIHIQSLSFNLSHAELNRRNLRAAQISLKRFLHITVAKSLCFKNSYIDQFFSIELNFTKCIAIS